jgi:hypothetical protein
MKNWILEYGVSESKSKHEGVRALLSVSLRRLESITLNFFTYFLL